MGSACCCSGEDYDRVEIIGASQYFVRTGGDILEAYDFGRRLGEGASGFVVEGTSRPSRSGRPSRRAVKILTHPVVGDAGGDAGASTAPDVAGPGRKSYEAALKEVMVLSALAHPNIVQLYEVFQDNAQTHIVLEFCCGGSLFQSVLKEQRFPEATAQCTMRQVLRAVRYLHFKRIVHRDLKCENFLWMDSSSLNGGALKLVDFGTARRYNPGQSMKSAVGTPLYISPEIIKGKYTESCDLWACGCMLYILLSGYAPFQGKTTVETYKLIATASLRFRDEEWAAVSEEARGLVAGLLDRRVRQRLKAPAALVHEWFSEAERSLSAASGPSAPSRPLALEDEQWLGQRVSDFSKYGTFKRIALYIVAHLAREEDPGISVARRVFEALDTDGLGELSRAALLEALPPVPAMARALDLLGCSEGGGIDWRAFLTVALGPEHFKSEAVLLEAFDFLDEGRHGFLEVSDIGRVLRLAACSGVWHLMVGSRGSLTSRQVWSELGRDDYDGLAFSEFSDIVLSAFGVPAASGPQIVAQAGAFPWSSENIGSSGAGDGGRAGRSWRSEELADPFNSPCSSRTPSPNRRGFGAAAANAIGDFSGLGSSSPERSLGGPAAPKLDSDSEREERAFRRFEPKGAPVLHGGLGQEPIGSDPEPVPGMEGI